MSSEMKIFDKVVTLEEEAAEFGFRWETTEQIMEQILSECQEINAHLHQGIHSDRKDLQEEIGDLLHAAFSLCVFCNFSPKDTVNQTLDKFERRLNAVKSIAQEQGFSNLNGKNFEDLMQIWKTAKQRVG